MHGKIIEIAPTESEVWNFDECPEDVVKIGCLDDYDMVKRYPNLFDYITDQDVDRDKAIKELVLELSKTGCITFEDKEHFSVDSRGTLLFLNEWVDRIRKYTVEHLTIDTLQRANCRGGLIKIIDGSEYAPDNIYIYDMENYEIYNIYEWIKYFCDPDSPCQYRIGKVWDFHY